MNHGDEVTVLARLTREDGPVLSGKLVRLYARDLSTGEWVLAAEGMTGSDGTMGSSRTPAATIVFAAVYAGSTRTWGSHSILRRVGVRPIVTLQVDGGDVDGEDVVHLPFGTTSAELQGTVTPAHPGRTVVITVERLSTSGAVTSTKDVTAPLDGSGTSYTYELPTSSGRYRLRVTLRRHRDHARGRSSDLYLTVATTP